LERAGPHRQPVRGRGQPRQADRAGAQGRAVGGRARSDVGAEAVARRLQALHPGLVEAGGEGGGQQRDQRDLAGDRAVQGRDRRGRCVDDGGGQSDARARRQGAGPDRGVGGSEDRGGRRADRRHHHALGRQAAHRRARGGDRVGRGDHHRDRGELAGRRRRQPRAGGAHAALVARPAQVGRSRRRRQEEGDARAVAAVDDSRRGGRRHRRRAGRLLRRAGRALRARFGFVADDQVVLAQAEDVSLRIALTIAGYFVLSTPFILLERWLPAPGARPHRAIARDLSACAIVLAMSLPISWLVFDHAFLRLAYALELSDWFHPPRLRPWARIAIALVGTDFTLYWLHRALHARLLWPAHRWHHAPAGLYWLSGMRASFAHNLLYVLN